jgi:4-hydroxy-tetrahydrodipicolinate reductase
MCAAQEEAAMTAKLVIAGAAGRMGTRIGALAADDTAVKVVYGLEASDTKAQAAYPVGADRAKIADADVVIDFTAAEATEGLLADVVRYGKGYVIGTTGFSPAQEAKIADAAKRIPIVKSSNMSLGVNVFFKVAHEMAKALPGYEIHIEETHHVHKKDAPSGTALQAGRLMEQAPGVKVTYKSIREGEVVGDHRIFFRGPADHIELFHHADSRDIFAAGALTAAKWVAGRKPGLYTMWDVLGI